MRSSKNARLCSRGTDLHTATLAWPFFTDQHRRFAGELSHWAAGELKTPHAHADPDDTCRTLVRRYGEAGWLRYSVPAAYGGALDELDVRTLCIAREILARRSGLADFAFAMQGLGAGPISLFGSESLRRRYLPLVAAGDMIAAFAISEAEAGSDIASMRSTAAPDGDHYVLNGEKTWISNGGIADFYVVFCRLQHEERKFVAIVVEPSDPGFSVAERIPLIVPHPLATIRLDECRVPSNRLVGDSGAGLKIALATLDVFRTTVGAAALGFARRALEEAVSHVRTRRVFGRRLAEFQLTQAKVATMATEIDASALLVYRAAWKRDTSRQRVTREASMAKLYATEAAQRVIDSAVQLLGGRGVVSGEPVEELYREIRSLRIYEGTSEVQQLVIARHIMEAMAGEEQAHA